MIKAEAVEGRVSEQTVTVEIGGLTVAGSVQRKHFNEDFQSITLPPKMTIELPGGSPVAALQFPDHTIDDSTLSAMFACAQRISVPGSLEILNRRGTVLTGDPGTRYTLEHFRSAHNGSMNVSCETDDPTASIQVDGIPTQGTIFVDSSFQFVG